MKNKNTNNKPAAAAKPAVKPAAASAKPAAADQPAAKPLVDLAKLKTSGLRKALNQETSMKPAIAAAYRAELESRMAGEYREFPTKGGIDAIGLGGIDPSAKPAAAKPAVKPAAASTKPAAAAAKPAAAAAKPADDTLAIHVNKTGRVCFAKAAAARLAAFFGDIDQESRYCLMAIDDKGEIRLEPSKKKADGALPVRDASGRPYVSATKQFKPLGFDGSRPYDIEAKPLGAAGFVFRLSA